MTSYLRVLVVGVLVPICAVIACRSTTEAPPPVVSAHWDVEKTEILLWRADHRAFEQDYALEASGMVAIADDLYFPSEKYARLIRLDPEDAMAATVVRLDVPRHSELEGVTAGTDALYFCDEAHAAVYAVRLDDLAAGTEPVPAEELSLDGIDVSGGKVGLEGIAVVDDRLWLLLERSGEPESGCVSTIFPMRLDGGTVVADGEPFIIELEDCNWRLTGLEPWRGRLLALKTQFPGNRYEVIAIDPETGEWHVVLEMTALLRGVRAGGWGNNVEGIAIADDGALWMVGDNAVTGIIDDPEPPPTSELAILLRIPPTHPPGS